MFVITIYIFVKSSDEKLVVTVTNKIKEIIGVDFDWYFEKFIYKQNKLTDNFV